MTDNENQVRINKFLADAGICSRRKADEMIRADQVLVNSQIATLGDHIDPQHDKVVVGKTEITAQPKLEYWALNKPLGAISTVSDERGRVKVTDLVPTDARIYPVGRLDENSDGLLILTNDGHLTNLLTHPSNRHVKLYRVIAKQNRSMSLSKIKDQMERGIIIGGKRMRVREVKTITKSETNNYVEMELELITGYNRQIRRMCDKIGLEVKKLTRIGFAKLRLADLNLAPGEARQINKEDII